MTHAVHRQGDVFLAGERVTDLPTFELARRGLRRTFQQNAFFGELTLLENAMARVLRESDPLPRSILLPWREMATRRTAERAAAELLSSFGIGPRRPWQAAGLYRLRHAAVALGRVLAYGAGARALLIDEPAAGTGGTRHEAPCRPAGSSCAAAASLSVVIEHHMDLIMAIADRIVVIDQGRKLAEGTPAEVQRNAAVLEAYLGRAA